MRKSTLITVAAIPVTAALLACGAGTSTSTTGGKPNTAVSAPTVATVKVGQPLTLDQTIITTKMTATIVLSNVRVVKASEFEKPSKGQYLAADVAVSVTAGKFSISSGSFKLVAADGTAYDAGFLSSVPSLSASDLAPGQKTSGSVVFDVANGAEKGGKIALTNLFASGDAGYWTL